MYADGAQGAQPQLHVTEHTNKLQTESNNNNKNNNNNNNDRKKGRVTLA